MGTRYRYVLPHGESGPPNAGVPPGNPPNPPDFHPPGFPPNWMIPPFRPTPGFFFGHPPPPPGPPGWVCHPQAPPKPKPTMVCHPTSGPPREGPFFFSSPPPDPVSCACHPQASSASPPTYICHSFEKIPPPYSDVPPPGARVKGLLPTFPDKNSGYIFPKSNCTFHLVKGDKKPWDHVGMPLDFKVVNAPTSMKLNEFIEQVGAIARAGPGVPRDRVGVQEILEAGNGVWRKGSEFMLDDWQGQSTLEDIGWSNDRGEAGRSKPVILVFLP